MIVYVMDTAKAIFQLVADLLSFLCLMLRPGGALAAENLFLCKQLAFYRERNIKPRLLDAATRLALVGALSFSIGKTLWWSFNPGLRSGGIVKVSGCCGDGNRWRAGYLLYGELLITWRQTSDWQFDLHTPDRCHQANSLCERAIGTMRREGLDHMIPLTEKHLRRILKGWVVCYNRVRPHSALGPGVPDPQRGTPVHLQKKYTKSEAA